MHTVSSTHRTLLCFRRLNLRSVLILQHWFLPILRRLTQAHSHTTLPALFVKPDLAVTNTNTLPVLNAFSCPSGRATLVSLQAWSINTINFKTRANMSATRQTQRTQRTKKTSNNFCVRYDTHKTPIDVVEKYIINILQYSMIQTLHMNINIYIYTALLVLQNLNTNDFLQQHLVLR